MSILFSSDRGKFFPISHFISPVLWWSCHQMKPIFTEPAVIVHQIKLLIPD